jgi:hypothetical protein
MIGAAMALASWVCVATVLGQTRGRAGGEQASRTPVLVELFTSEGCSSCPPADALLARLEMQQPVAGAEVIVLEEHVDYWDSLGWHDRFSSHQFTERQGEYAKRLRLDSDYTPQMIVDGREEFVGNDAAHALRAIAKAARTPKFDLTVSPLMVDGDRVSGTISVSGTSTLQKAELYAALVDRMATTQVLRGENGGRTLHHVSVVRAMERIGAMDALGQGAVGFTLRAPKDSSAAGSRVVVFAQRSDGAIVGVSSAAAVQTGAARMAAR